MKAKNALVVLVTATLLMACGGSSVTPPPSAGARDEALALETLSGTYADGDNGYPYGKAFGKRVFTFSQGNWTLDFVLALDPAFKTPVFRFRTLGTYTVQGPSGRVAGAHEAVFREAKKFLTLLAEPSITDGFGFGACGLTKDVEKDVSGEGCLGWKPVTICGQDYDLLALTPEGGVRFGTRPADNDMCTPEKRPTELTPAVMPRR